MNPKRHKNQMVITALALMIAVAGYLNFSGKEIDLLEETAVEETAVVADEELSLEEDLGDDDMLVSMDELEVAEGTTTADSTTEEKEVSAIDEDSLEVAESEAASAGVEDLDVVDNQEISAKVDDDIQETVSVSSQNVSSSILQAQLTKEQNRAKNKEMLMEIVNSKEASEAQKEEASAKLLQISEFMEKEAATQELLTAKGYSNSMVSMSEDSVDVAVNAEELTDVDRAKIEDVVQRKTGVSMQNIVISTYHD